MKKVHLALALLWCCSFTILQPASGQSSDRPPALAKFPFEASVPLKIVRDAIPSHPFTVVGPRGAILGAQDGSFEAWVFPWKIFRAFVGRRTWWWRLNTDATWLQTSSLAAPPSPAVAPGLV